MKISTLADLFILRLATLLCAAILCLSACYDSSSNDVTDNDGNVDDLESVIEYIKASNTWEDDSFGVSVALSGDGNTLAVGATGEDSSAKGPKHPGDPDYYTSQEDDSAAGSGAVYVFTRSGTTWNQQAYIKAPNTEANDLFGRSVALSDDGNILAVGAPLEDSNGVGGLVDNSVTDSGAVYIFTRSDDTWDFGFYVKASNSGEEDRFGNAIALSGDGITLAVGVQYEDSCDWEDPENDDCEDTGAVYVFVNDASFWYQQAYLKAIYDSDFTDPDDRFGAAVALSDDGDILAVGAPQEDSANTGQLDNSATNSGAVYVFDRFPPSNIPWGSSKYLKASNVGTDDGFGKFVALSGDGETLAVGAASERSDGSSQDDNSAIGSGAVYVFTGANITWHQTSWLKAPNIDPNDNFGYNVALSRDGDTLAVGAVNEDSSATGINGDMNDNSGVDSGAVYLFPAIPGSGLFLASDAYIKPSNTEASAVEFFAASLALSGNGDTLAVGAFRESSSATGIGGDASDNSAIGSGAVYLYDFD